MKVIWNEYAGAVLGIAAASGITGILVNLLLPGGSIYEAVRSFAEGIC